MISIALTCLMCLAYATSFSSFSLNDRCPFEELIQTHPGLRKGLNTESERIIRYVMRTIRPAIQIARNPVEDDEEFKSQLTLFRKVLIAYFKYSNSPSLILHVVQMLLSQSSSTEWLEVISEAKKFLGFIDVNESNFEYVLKSTQLVFDKDSLPNTTLYPLAFGWLSDAMKKIDKDNLWLPLFKWLKKGSIVDNDFGRKVMKLVIDYLYTNGEAKERPEFFQVMENKPLKYVYLHRTLASNTFARVYPQESKHYKDQILAILADLRQSNLSLNLFYAEIVDALLLYNWNVGELRDALILDSNAEYDNEEYALELLKYAYDEEIYNEFTKVSDRFLNSKSIKERNQKALSFAVEFVSRLIKKDNTNNFEFIGKGLSKFLESENLTLADLLMQHVARLKTIHVDNLIIKYMRIGFTPTELEPLLVLYNKKMNSGGAAFLFFVESNVKLFKKYSAVVKKNAERQGEDFLQNFFTQFESWLDGPSDDFTLATLNFKLDMATILMGKKLTQHKVLNENELWIEFKKLRR